MSPKQAEQVALVLKLALSVPRVFQDQGTPDDLDFILSHLKQAVCHRGVSDTLQTMIVELLGPISKFKAGMIGGEELVTAVKGAAQKVIGPKSIACMQVINNLQELKKLAVWIHFCSKKAASEAASHCSAKGGSRLVYSRDTLLGLKHSCKDRPPHCAIPSCIASRAYTVPAKPFQQQSNQQTTTFPLVKSLHKIAVVIGALTPQSQDEVLTKIKTCLSPDTAGVEEGEGSSAKTRPPPGTAGMEEAETRPLPDATGVEDEEEWCVDMPQSAIEIEQEWWGDEDTSLPTLKIENALLKDQKGSNGVSAGLTPPTALVGVSSPLQNKSGARNIALQTGCHAPTVLATPPPKPPARVPTDAASPTLSVSVQRATPTSSMGYFSTPPSGSGLQPATLTLPLSAAGQPGSVQIPASGNSLATAPPPSNLHTGTPTLLSVHAAPPPIPPSSLATQPISGTAIAMPTPLISSQSPSSKPLPTKASTQTPPTLQLKSPENTWQAPPPKLAWPEPSSSSSFASSNTASLTPSTLISDSSLRPANTSTSTALKTRSTLQLRALRRAHSSSSTSSSGPICVYPMAVEAPSPSPPVGLPAWPGFESAGVGSTGGAGGSDSPAKDCTTKITG